MHEPEHHLGGQQTDLVALAQLRFLRLPPDGDEQQRQQERQRQRAGAEPGKLQERILLEDQIPLQRHPETHRI